MDCWRSRIDWWDALCISKPWDRCNNPRVHFPNRWVFHSCWHSGHRLFSFTHNEMQQWWNEWLQSPQATTQSCFPVSFLHSAWQCRHVSINWTRQMAQVSHSTSQLHIATAFHFFSVKMFSGFASASNLLQELSLSSAISLYWELRFTLFDLSLQLTICLQHYSLRTND